jgi:hypothetical protein
MPPTLARSSKLMQVYCEAPPPGLFLVAGARPRFGGFCLRAFRLRPGCACSAFRVAVVWGRGPRTRAATRCQLHCGCALGAGPENPRGVMSHWTCFLLGIVFRPRAAQLSSSRSLLCSTGAGMRVTCFLKPLARAWQRRSAYCSWCLGAGPENPHWPYRMANLALAPCSLCSNGLLCSSVSKEVGGAP